MDDKDRGIGKQSFFVLLTELVSGSLAYIYHIVMGRMLSVEEYAVLATIISLFYILSVPSAAIQTTIAKFVSQFKAKEENEKISSLLSKSFKKLFLIALILAFLLVIFTPIISNFLHISSPIPFLILSVIVFYSFLLPIAVGAIQGLQKFNYYNLNALTFSSSKLVFAAILVLLGFGVAGALFAFVLAALAGAAILLYGLRNYLKRIKTSVFAKEIYLYSFPALIILFCLMIFFNIDLILVKHFFSPYEAGNYAVASVLGKVMFFGSTAIAMVLFPKASQLNAAKKSSLGLLKKSLLYVFIFSFLVFIAYWFFPSFIINLLLGPKYPVAIQLLPLFGLTMFFFSFCNLITYYNLAIQNKRIIFPMIFFAVMEIILLILFHSTLFTVIHVLLWTIALLFLTLLIELILLK
ncbi:MAG: oligosaccharide flippase family protein [archaeon]